MKWRRFVSVIFLFVFFSLCSKAAHAASSNEEIMKELQMLKKKVFEQENKIAELESKLTQVKAGKVRTIEMTEEEFNQHIDQHLLHRIPGYELINGLKMGLGATLVYQFTDRANGDSLSANSEDIGDASYSVDIEFEKNFDEYGAAFLHLETGDGAGVEDELKVFSNVNRDADDSDSGVSLTEAWYEHYLGSLTITGGKIDATGYIDTNAYANDECCQFLGRIFRNSPTIEFADNAAGLRLSLAPNDLFNIETVVMDADGDWEDLFEGIFFAGQINIKPKLFNKEGNFRILGWLNDRQHTKWTDSSESKEKGYGFGVSFDQEITENIGVFARYAWQDPKVYLNGEDFSLEHSYSFGVQLNGALWGRDDDAFGLAFGQIVPSDDYKNAGSLEAKTEGHLETYYSFKVNDHLTISPDLHVIFKPYGNDATNGDKTIVVGGIRSQIDF